MLAVTFEKFESPSKQYLRDIEWQSKLDFQLCFRQDSFTFHLEFVVVHFQHVWLYYRVQLHKKNLCTESDTFLLFYQSPPKSAKLQMTRKNCASIVSDTYQWLKVTLNFIKICQQALQNRRCKWRICILVTLYLNDNTPKKPGKRLRVGPSL